MSIGEKSTDVEVKHTKPIRVEEYDIHDIPWRDAWVLVIGGQKSGKRKAVVTILQQNPTTHIRVLSTQDRYTHSYSGKLGSKTMTELIGPDTSIPEKPCKPETTDYPCLIIDPITTAHYRRFPDVNRKIMYVCVSRSLNKTSPEIRGQFDVVFIGNRLSFADEQATYNNYGTSYSFMQWQALISAVATDDRRRFLVIVLTSPGEVRVGWICTPPSSPPPSSSSSSSSSSVEIISTEIPKTRQPRLTFSVSYASLLPSVLLSLLNTWLPLRDAMRFYCINKTNYMCRHTHLLLGRMFERSEHCPGNIIIVTTHSTLSLL